MFIHYAFTDHDKAASFARWLDGKGKTVYYALASFTETFQNKNDKTRIKRTKKNVDRLKALWLDIDEKDCPNGALGATKDFLEATKLPRPSIVVRSGHGIHLYWPLSRAIPVDEWAPLAEALKAETKAHGYPADHACTSDPARVLRPPGTTNRKYPDNPQPVTIVWEKDDVFEPDALAKLMGAKPPSAIPSYMRGVSADSCDEFTGSNHKRPTSAKELVRNCAVMKHNLITGGREQTEPEWNATLLVLKYVDDGYKLLHPISSKHIDYDHDATEEKWQQKLAAETTGPTLCPTLEGYGHTKLCQACPIYKSRKQKTPLSLAYMKTGAATLPPAAPIPKAGTVIPKTVTQLNHDFPDRWRGIPGNGGVERKVFDKEAAEWVYDKVLDRTWRLKQVQKSANTGSYTYIIEARMVSGEAIEFEVPGALAYGCPRTWEVLGERGAILKSTEKQHWTDLMSTWLQKLQEEAAVIDTTDQLGWIERINDEGDKRIVGFASGAAAFFKDGGVKQSIVTANHKHKGIASYYTPVGKLNAWRETSGFLIEQGHDHIVAMIAAAFAGPLMKFSGQSGAIMSFVSNNTSAGKSVSMETAMAVWGHPKLGGMTLSDTPTSTKNKIAYLQNITAFWDEARGDEQAMRSFVETAFQVTQGKDRERADRSARTIAAQTWHTMLVVASNDSIFDLTAAHTGASDAGVYRIFECFIPDDEKPQKDPRVSSMVAQLQNNYGLAGEEFAKYLAANVSKVRDTVEKRRLALEDHFNAEPAERFWIAALTVVITAADFANRAGLTEIDLAKLMKYLQKKFMELRARVRVNRITTDPRELITAYQMQHMADRLVVDKLRIGAGGGAYQPQLIGSYSNLRKVLYQIGKDQNIMRVVKADFCRWLDKTRGLKLSGELAARFKKEAGMKERKAVLALNTQYATNRAICLDFDIDMEDIDE